MGDFFLKKFYPVIKIKIDFPIRKGIQVKYVNQQFQNTTTYMVQNEY